MRVLTSILISLSLLTNTGCWRRSTNTNSSVKSFPEVNFSDKKLCLDFLCPREEEAFLYSLTRDKSNEYYFLDYIENVEKQTESLFAWISTISREIREELAKENQNQQTVENLKKEKSRALKIVRSSAVVVMELFDRYDQQALETDPHKKQKYAKCDYGDGSSELYGLCKQHRVIEKLDSITDLRKELQDERNISQSPLISNIGEQAAVLATEKSRILSNYRGKFANYIRLIDSGHNITESIISTPDLALASTPEALFEILDNLSLDFYEKKSSFDHGISKKVSILQGISSGNISANQAEIQREMNGVEQSRHAAEIEKLTAEIDRIEIEVKNYGNRLKQSKGALVITAEALIGDASATNTTTLSSVLSIDSGDLLNGKIIETGTAHIISISANKHPRIIANGVYGLTSSMIKLKEFKEKIEQHFNSNVCNVIEEQAERNPVDSRPGGPRGDFNLIANSNRGGQYVDPVKCEEKKKRLRLIENTVKAAELKWSKIAKVQTNLAGYLISAKDDVMSTDEVPSGAFGADFLNFSHIKENRNTEHYGYQAAYYHSRSRHPHLVYGALVAECLGPIGDNTSSDFYEKRSIVHDYISTFDEHRNDATWNGLENVSKEIYIPKTSFMIGQSGVIEVPAGCKRIRIILNEVALQPENGTGKCAGNDGEICTSLDAPFVLNIRKIGSLAAGFDGAKKIYDSFLKETSLSHLVHGADPYSEAISALGQAFTAENITNELAAYFYPLLKNQVTIAINTQKKSEMEARKLILIGRKTELEKSKDSFVAKANLIAGIRVAISDQAWTRELYRNYLDEIFNLNRKEMLYYLDKYSHWLNVYIDAIQYNKSRVEFLVVSNQGREIQKLISEFEEGSRNLDSRIWGACAPPSLVGEEPDPGSRPNVSLCSELKLGIDIENLKNKIQRFLSEARTRTIFSNSITQNSIHHCSISFDQEGITHPDQLMGIPDLPIEEILRTGQQRSRFYVNKSSSLFDRNIACDMHPFPAVCRSEGLHTAFKGYYAINFQSFLFDGHNWNTSCKDSPDIKSKIVGVAFEWGSDGPVDTEIAKTILLAKSNLTWSAFGEGSKINIIDSGVYGNLGQAIPKHLLAGPRKVGFYHSGFLDDMCNTAPRNYLSPLCIQGMLGSQLIVNPGAASRYTFKTNFLNQRPGNDWILYLPIGFGNIEATIDQISKLKMHIYLLE